MVDLKLFITKDNCVQVAWLHENKNRLKFGVFGRVRRHMLYLKTSSLMREIIETEKKKNKQ